MEPAKQLDAASLKALAHPLRVELFRALSEAPATSTQLAERLGHNTGTISWHLRHLARFGFIEDSPGHGDARERWWQAAVRRTRLNVLEGDILGDPAALEAARWYVSDHLRRQWLDLQHWVETAEEWDQEWIAASVMHDEAMDLTPDELAALRDELLEVVARHRRPRGHNPSPDATRVQVNLQTFPKGESDEPRESDKPGESRESREADEPDESRESREADEPGESGE